MSRTTARLTGFLVCACAFAQGQNPDWTLLQPAGLQPSARYDGTIAYDPPGRQVLLFGGQDSTGVRNDLWAYSFDTQRWTQLLPSGGPPAARFGHTLVFDSTRRRVILFGGQAGGFFNDVWAYDIALNQWAQIGDDTGPSRRYGHGAIYETARDRMVITHGFTTSGRFDDTWAFDFKSKAWTNLTPPDFKPLKRCLHHTVYDQTRGQMYMYGGCASGFGPCPLGDLWSFDLNTNTWLEKTPLNSPAPRYHDGMAFDDSRSRLVLFGGFGSDLLGDTWEFNPVLGQWQTLTHSGVEPAARQRQETTFATGIGTVMFGGQTAAGSSNELWLLPSSAITVVNAFSGTGGGVAPGELVSIYGSGLGPAAGIAQEFDPATGKLPVTAAGVAVLWNSVPAPLYYVSAGQLNVQVPYELAGSSQATLTVAGISTTVPLAPTHPGVFPLVFNSDFTANSATNPAARGSVIFFYATGQGVTSPASVTGKAAIGVYPDPVAAVTVSHAQVVFKGQAPYTAGVMQVNATLSADAPVGDAVPIRLTIGGVAAQDLSVSIR